MDFITIGIDGLVLSLGVDKLIETKSPKQHGQLSHMVDALVVPESTMSMPISKEKELEVEKPSVKPSSHKKRKLDYPLEVETEPIPVLNLDIDNVKLKNIQIESTCNSLWREDIWKTRGVVGCIRLLWK